VLRNRLVAALIVVLVVRLSVHARRRLLCGVEIAAKEMGGLSLIDDDR